MRAGKCEVVVEVASDSANSLLGTKPQGARERLHEGSETSMF